MCPIPAPGSFAASAARFIGVDRLIDFCAAPDVQRIIFIEAPQVMGSEAWRYPIREGLRRLAKYPHDSRVVG